MKEMQAPRTINDLRNLLVEEIMMIRDGVRAPKEANAIVNATGKIIATVKMEFEYAKLTGTVPKIPFMDGSRRGKIMY